MPFFSATISAMMDRAISAGVLLPMYRLIQGRWENVTTQVIKACVAGFLVSLIQSEFFNAFMLHVFHAGYLRPA
ncbi:hypothetical protein ACO0LD_18330 [Undibacterium sp. Ji83W]|uniref:hypothetical protein n=1 Tax=Undibacterium sp. Ji83W TaxID=3413043 RepID=UPI003BF3EFEB